jgi:hypothetical protein
MITRHPLYQTADRVKKALLVNGFELVDDGISGEIVGVEQDALLYTPQEGLEKKPIMLDTKEHILRRTLIPQFLSKIGNAVPLRKFACGRVYDGNDPAHPARLCIEGVLSGPDMKYLGISELFGRIATDLCGLGTTVEVRPYALKSYEIEVSAPDGKKFTLGCACFARWETKAILHLEDYTNKTWLFTIDIDSLAVSLYGLSGREDLFDCDIEHLKSFECSAPAVGDGFRSKASNALRMLGYSEYIGEPVYREDEYMRMHMFQDEWDENNKAVRLVEPFGDRTGLPTVLNPGIEQAIAANQEAGRAEARLFDIEHTFLPGPHGSKYPREKTSLVIGAYGQDMDIVKFKAEIDEFLTKLGIRKHYIVKNGVPKAYHREESYLVMNDGPMYLGGNLGGINPVAEENYGIRKHSYMAHFEVDPLAGELHTELMFKPKELP